MARRSRPASRPNASAPPKRPIPASRLPGPVRRPVLLRGQRGHGADDRVIPASTLPGASRPARAPRRQRRPPAARRGRGEARPVRPARPGERGDQAGRLVDVRGQPGPHRGERNDATNGSRCRPCSAPSSESMLGPTTRAVEKRGSSTVNRLLSRSTRRAMSRRVTSQPPSAGSHDTGSRARSRRSSGADRRQARRSSPRRRAGKRCGGPGRLAADSFAGTSGEPATP